MKGTIEHLVQKYSSMVLQIAYQYSFNKSEAEDITQEVFIKLYNNIKKIKNEEHIKAWLIRVTINLSIDYNRNYWNKNTTSLDDNYKYFDEETKDVFNELKKLTPEFRNIIYLYYYQGYKISEISEILSMNQNTVSSYLGRARKELKHILEQGGELYA